MQAIVIIGAGQAGIGAAAELRRRGFTGSITVVGDETHAPYQRPPLSKEILAGTPVPALYLYPEKFYADQAITLRLGRRAVAIERDAQRVGLDDGTSLAYDHLLIATGARPRPLELPGLTASDPIYLRGLEDAARLAERCSAARRVAIVGGGFIGLEVAAYLSARSIPAVVIEAAPQLMGRVVSPTTAQHMLKLHRATGVDVRLGAGVREVEPIADSGWRLLLADGTELEVEAVIAAVGALANCELAAQAGLTVDRGIVVDRLLQTSDPAISAIGDCAVHPDPVSGRPVRLESVQNAVDQGKAFAARIAGQPEPYASLPWFWSTQGSARLQIAGIAPARTEDIARTDPADASRLVVFRFDGERLAAVETINQPGDHLQARKLLSSGRSVTPQALREAGLSLKPLL
jgi:3-phenylpropionate/trans-cinnamate dioxygenase ferredoxin reductase subunit